VAKTALDTCSWCSAATWCEQRKGGRPQCAGCKVVAFFKYLYRPLGFTLLGWQEKVLRDLFGTVQVDTGLRRYRRGYISMAKKQGKSFLIGGLPIFHLIHENEIRPEAYGAAASKDQAGIVFRAAALLVRANPDLLARLKILDSTRRITHRHRGGFYAVLSADGDVNDGIEPSLAMIDELHRWKTEKAETLYKVITKGMISRSQPLEVEITTAGEVYKSELCFRQYQYAKQVLSGSLQSDRFYAAIWEADAKRLAEDTEYWKSREARVAANPSHEDLGGFLKDEAIVEELNNAIAVPANYPDYLRYQLNVWVQDVHRAIDLAQWDACPMDWKAEGWPLSDDFVARFANRPCWIGVDLSATTDLTAMTMVFPREDGHFDLVPFIWATAKALRQLDGSVANRRGPILVG
jgi:phage terminase large subunit-like protein